MKRLFVIARRLFIYCLVLGVIAVIAFAVCNYMVVQAGKGRVYDRVDEIPARDWGLVLGTSEHRVDGGANPYFDNRIAAAAKLYHQGRVKRLLVSGDNHTQNYNEPADMRRALIAQGVPASAIREDDAGLRTLDSIFRAKKVFDLQHFTIISQRAHDDRSLLIAKYYGIDAIAYAADDIDFKYAPRTHIREWFSEVKVILDLYVLHTKPHFLGPQIDVNSPAA